MNTFPEVKRFNHPELEKETLRWWNEHEIFAKSIGQRGDAPVFSFYEGPPTANGRPGIHHVMSRTIKDIFCRYKTMKGYRVSRKAGWDTHGLPVEIEVEKELGLAGRQEVVEYGIERFNRACRESVLRYTEQWDELTSRMGYWVDLKNPYVTYENEYIESVWWLIKQIHEKGLLYKGHKIQWYSPGSGTVLSSHEVSLGYKEVQDPSVFVRFPIAGEENSFFLAWTTTPWTLISNTALAVGPSITYVRIKVDVDGGGSERLVLAKDRLETIRAEYAIEAEMPGAELVGQRFEPLYDYFVGEVEEGSAWKVVSADYVSTEDGTGIVHTAPAFGAEDFETAQRENLPLVNPIAGDGRFMEIAALVSGQWFKDADKTIIRDLKSRGLMYRHETFMHNYPHDWRKGTPLMSYPVDSWFVRTTAIKDRLIELNNQINWHPQGIGDGRFGEWLENNVDWALSRRRFWGTPLPIWKSDAEGSEYCEVIGSIDELRMKCGDQLPHNDDLDLHRPYVDQFTWPSPDGGTMRRVEDLIDVWFDSGAMPFAQWHYPFENDESFEESFPADFIAEGVDQTRGWFYTLHAIAALCRDSVAYRNVVVNGLVLDEAGEKMSKTKGNATDPFDVINTYGADVARWYLMSNSPPWENLKFTERGMQDTLRKFFSTLENVYGFFATYANIDGFRFEEELVPISQRPELDRWIISRLNSLISEVDDALHDYNTTRSARAIESFVEALSNWHIRRSRRRFWKSDGDPSDKLSAYQTVFECLVSVAKLMSPTAPFFGEWMYQSLNRTTGRHVAESVHLASFPEVRLDAIDADLERRMQIARTICSVVLSLRNKSSINVRQPLSQILVVVGHGLDEQDVHAVEQIVLDEVNVKAIELVSSSSGLVVRSAKPNFQVLGKRLGKLMKGVNQAVRAWDDETIETFQSDGEIVLTIDGAAVPLTSDDIVVTSEGIEGWLVDTEDGVTVALDTKLSPELAREGLAREMVNRIQNLRKQAGFEVTDRIVVTYQATPNMEQAVAAHADWIRNETLALELQEAVRPDGDLVTKFDVYDDDITIGVRRVAV
ncbi:MAG: isoleucine--tRNA ligase [Rhodothermales bacterium]|nr:isoleucine--tRNA ligase [Rhodothermales bacterium]